MYNGFFGFDVDPFRVNPDPRFLYFSESHREALATLVYAVKERKGFIVLTGEVGTGKTTVLNALMQKLDRKVRSAYLCNSALSLEDFFAYLFEELGIEPVEPFRKAATLHRLNHFLIDRLRQGQQTLLLVDEAQNLSAELLEEIRLLSNLETPQSKLIQIILVGQPELADKLERPELRQLRQRIELRHTIRPLTGDEAAEYVKERMLIAGHESGDVFGISSLRAVARLSQGIPRVINVICDNALLISFARDSLRVSAAMVAEAAADMGLASTPLRVAMNGSEQGVRRPVGLLRRLWPFGRAATELGI